MKLAQWSFLVFVITGILFLGVALSKSNTVLSVPLLIIFLVFTLTLASSAYNFRASLQPQNIPLGNKKRIEELNRESEKLKALGFEKIDEFYLKTIPDVVLYAFKHPQKPFIFCFYHFGKKMSADVLSWFDSEFALDTCNSTDAGVTPRPAKKFLQVFALRPWEFLITEHEKSHQFLKSKGLAEYPVRSQEFRSRFMNDYRQSAAFMRRSFFWPAKVIWGIFTQHGRRYGISIIDQYQKGMIKIYQDYPEVH